jgi:2'-5' RNA ligase
VSPVPERMRDHWWWRPGVRPGRRVLVWHILVDDQPEARALAETCQEQLAGVPGLDLIPAEWLHMTTQVIGFADEISAAEVRAMTASAAERLQLLGPLSVELRRVLFFDEGVALGIHPPRALDPVRTGIRDAVAENVTAHQLADEPAWTPHLSVAYSNSEGSAAPIIEALTARPEPCPLAVRDVRLVSQERVDHLYRWDQIATIPLGG